MKPINLRSFAQKVSKNKVAFKKYLGKVEKKAPKNLYSTMLQINKEVWDEVDCLTCANCCKKMTPTFTNKDVTRIAAHLDMTTTEFKDKWLYYDEKDGDWMNTKQPCQFLNSKNNMCSIYEVRPADCSGFPHFTKKNPTLYLHVHQQNIQYCPATYRMVEKLIEKL
ncbi:MAG: YkgJ family cysteine cluster protein [Bacteroidetes bacterium]|nr:YkgJ family cysteine cluster protein [Bacteroidota bacterium]